MMLGYTFCFLGPKSWPGPGASIHKPPQAECWGYPPPSPAPTHVHTYACMVVWLYASGQVYTYTYVHVRRWRGEHQRNEELEKHKAKQQGYERLKLTTWCAYSLRKDEHNIWYCYGFRTTTSSGLTTFQAGFKLRLRIESEVKD